MTEQPTRSRLHCAFKNPSQIGNLLKNSTNITPNDHPCSARIMSAAFSPIMMQAASYGQLVYSAPSNTVQLNPALSAVNLTVTFWADLVFHLHFYQL